MTLSTLQDLNDKLIRKALNFGLFIADYSSPTIDETTLFDATTGDITTLPAGYKGVGFLNDNGAKFARAITKVDITSLQSNTPTRSDITVDETTVDISCQETKLVTLGLHIGVDFSGIVPGTNGVVRVDQPKVASQRSYRALAIAEDTTSSGSIYLCRYMPNATVDSVGDQSFVKSDAVMWPVVLKGLYDAATATAHSWIFAGPGWKALLPEMGLSDAS